MRIGIVGGGVLGMTLALRFTKAGHHVTIFESAPHVGGLAAPWQLGDVVWDRHYHVTLFSDLATRSLLDELGLNNSIRWVTTRTGFYTDGRLYSFSDVHDFLRFPPLNLLQKARLAATILHASRIRDWHPLEQLTALDWLRKYSGTQTVEKIWRPLLRAKLGVNADKASAAFIWATIARMYAARRTGMKRELFGYVEGGYATTLTRFERYLEDQGVQIFVNCPIERVEGAEGDTVTLLRTDGLAHRFDRVVTTLAAPLAARICPGLTHEERERLKGVEYQGIICASVLLDRPLADYYVTNITDTWVPFTGVIEMTAMVDRAHFNGLSLIYLPKYLPSNDPDFHVSDAAIEEEFIGALRVMYPSLPKNSVRAFRVSRVRYVLPITTLDYSRRLPPVRTSVPGLYIASSANIVNGTLNVNETIDLANRVAAGLLSDCADIQTSRIAS